MGVNHKARGTASRGGSRAFAPRAGQEPLHLPADDRFSRFRIDCAACSGLCCTALYFAKCEGFPQDKEAGKRCKNLLPDCLCGIHDTLAAKGMKGCLAFDCLGAGQAACALCGKPHSEPLFSAFLRLRALHGLLWCLTEVMVLLPARTLWARADALLREGEAAAAEDAAALLGFGLAAYGSRVEALLGEAAALVSRAVGGPARVLRAKDLLGYHFKKTPLDGCDLCGALLIAANLEGCSLRGANLYGADLRDARLAGADLTDCVFLPQPQLNGALGDGATRLPPMLERPAAWGGEAGK